jgi:MSHA biogenesis protein MshG
VSYFRRTLLVFLALVGMALVLAVLAAMLSYGGVVIFFVIMAIYGWVVLSFLHYRYGRQDELVHVLIAAAEMKAPLSSAVWAYVLDRPQGQQRELWVATLLFFILPGYYWIWHRRHSFDQKLARLARLLESGVPLGLALEQIPGLASADTRLAVAVGQSTGRLDVCLRALKNRRLGTVWLEVIPRFFYPLCLLAAIIGIMGFLTVFIIPKFQKIFADFHFQLPPLTQRFIEFSNLTWQYFWALPIAFLSGATVVAILVVSSTVRWFFPIVSRFYRMQVQSRLLDMLAQLLEAQTPVPEALAFLAAAPPLRGTVSRRLSAAHRAVDQGQPFIEALCRRGLLSRSAVAFSRAAERAHTLPWALRQLADVLGGRAARFLRQFSLAMTPVSVIAVASLVAFAVLAMFLPLIELLRLLS